MSTLTLDQIKAYSACPRQFGFREHITPKVSPPTIEHEIIKQCYINRSQHGYDPQWETIKTRVNKHYFTPVDIKDKIAFTTAYKASVATINNLYGWYYQTFLSDPRHGIANIPLVVEVSHSTIVASVDLILLDAKHGPVPLIFSSGQPIISLVNDITFKTLLWAIWKETDFPCTQVEWVTGVRYNKIWNHTSMDTIEKYVNFIVRGIENKIYYPSVNAQCASCEFREICVI